MVTVNLPDQDQDELKQAVRSGNFERFLSADVMDRNRPLAPRQSATVRDLIKHYANREGGVHFDPSARSANDLIEEVRDFADEDLRRTILACGRIVARAGTDGGCIDAERYAVACRARLHVSAATLTIRGNELGSLGEVPGPAPTLSAKSIEIRRQTHMA